MAGVIYLVEAREGTYEERSWIVEAHLKKGDADMAQKWFRDFVAAYKAEHEKRRESEPQSEDDPDAERWTKWSERMQKALKRIARRSGDPDLSDCVEYSVVEVPLK